MKKYSFCLVFILSIFTSSAQEKDQGVSIPWDEYHISLIKLISTPEKYDDKPIRTIGYLKLGFEHNAIYLHKEDFKKGLLENSFWVSFTNKLTDKEIKKYNNCYVLVEGIFDVNSKGHMSAFGGEVGKITRIEIWHK